MKFRVFFAINFPKKIQLILKDTLNILQQSIQEKIHWTSFYNLHITLGFLGNIQSEHIPQLIEHTKLQLGNCESFSLQLEKIQLFPSTKKPRIISFSTTPNDQLKEIVDCIRQAILATGYSTETRAFRGHLTLGRLRGAHVQGKLLEEIQLPTLLPIRVTQIDLLESQLGKGLPCYIPLAHFILK
ncbi:RNA 2',3'-cyclic phosphodiesterase [Legionella brunensis]|nr:RNA 2',3'-cyclic phosphodiesterase [Legionella brunensis]